MSTEGTRYREIPLKQPPLTRAHALAIMDPRHDLLVDEGDGRLTVTSSSTFSPGAAVAAGSFSRAETCSITAWRWPATGAGSRRGAA